MFRFIVTLAVGWLLCCAGGAMGGLLGCTGALGWPLSSQNVLGSALHGLQLGALFGVGVVSAACLVRPHALLRFVLNGAGFGSLLTALSTFYSVAAGAAV